MRARRGILGLAICLLAGCPPTTPPARGPNVAGAATGIDCGSTGYTVDSGGEGTCVTGDHGSNGLPTSASCSVTVTGEAGMKRSVIVASASCAHGCAGSSMLGRCSVVHLGH